MLWDVALEGMSDLLDRLQQLEVQHQGSISAFDIGGESSDAAKRLRCSSPP
ncbi:hypothetical protein [Leifsonia sp. AG29]|uniref:hypothetical protein n=1 Tax=Leifsonia sp. AG29 TaxID=2598860 RepID=UPI00131B4552|nr:hypothetical protein [Leifsonia sp. AG29]